MNALFHTLFHKFRRGAYMGLCLLLLAPNLALSPAGDDSMAAHCLVEIGKAIDSADSASFEKLVDLDVILNTALNVFLRDLDAMQAAGDVPPLLALLFSRAATQDVAGDQVRNLLISEARAFALNGISSGAFAGRPPTGQGAQGLLAPLFADASTGRKEIREIGTPRSEGKEWIISFVVRDAGNGESYPVQGRVSRAEGSFFRLTAVENLDELMRRINEERKKQEE